MQAFFDRVRRRVHQTIEYARVKVFPSEQEIITEMVFPRIVEGVTAEVRKAIVGVQWISFTTDLWSTDVSNDSSSLTAHSFERKLAVLHAQTFPGTDTGEAIMLRCWKMGN